VKKKLFILLFVCFDGLAVKCNRYNRYFTIGPTFTWYHQSTTNFFDSGSNEEQLLKATTKMVPGLFCDIVFYSKRKNKFFINGGINFSYSRRKGALIADLLESGQSTPIFSVKQDVSNTRITPYLELSKIYKNDFEWCAYIGLPLVPKTVTVFKIYEKSTDAYIGQRLRAGLMNIWGELGLSLTKKYYDFFDLKLEYSFAFGNAHYGRKIYIDTADKNASSHFKQQILLTDKDSITLAQKLTIKLKSHRIAFSIGSDI